MYGIFTYIWVIFRVNVGKYTIHGAFGYVFESPTSDDVHYALRSFHLPCCRMGDDGAFRSKIGLPQIIQVLEPMVPCGSPQLGC